MGGSKDSVDFTGKYYTVNDARVSEPPDPLPEIYFGGSSGATLPIAAEFADVYLTWGEPPQAAADKIDKVRAETAARGRAVRFGIRLHTISRATSDVAWLWPTSGLTSSARNRSPKLPRSLPVRNPRGSDG